MSRFRKKPVVIEAQQIRFGTDKFALTPEFLAALCYAGDCERGLVKYDNGDRIPHVHTLEGALHASNRDWLIRGVAGEFYPCKPDIFQATYEPVPEGEPA